MHVNRDAAQPPRLHRLKKESDHLRHIPMTRSKPPQRRGSLPAAAEAYPDTATRVAAGSPNVAIKLRRRQRLALDLAAGLVYQLESGCLTLDATLPGGRRHVMLVLYPGDLISTAISPPLPQVGLTAVVASAVSRIRVAERTAENGSGGVGADDVQRATANLVQRSGLHAAAIACLRGEERLATLILEMALNLGHVTPGGTMFELPLSRRDMADHLGLNPDTMSRLISRMKARGLIAMPSRARMIVKDLAALCTLSPVAEALAKIRASEHARQATAASLAPRQV